MPDAILMTEMENSDYVGEANFAQKKLNDHDVLVLLQGLPTKTQLLCDFFANSVEALQ